MPRGGSLVVVILSIALTAHAQEVIAPFVPPNANSVSGNVLRGQLLGAEPTVGRARRTSSAGSRTRSRTSCIHSPMAPRSATPREWCSPTSATRPTSCCGVRVRIMQTSMASRSTCPMGPRSAASIGRRGVRAASQGNQVSGRAVAEMAAPRRSTPEHQGIKRARHVPAVCIWERRRRATMAADGPDCHHRGRQYHHQHADRHAGDRNRRR